MLLIKRSWCIWNERLRIISTFVIQASQTPLSPNVHFTFLYHKRWHCILHEFYDHYVWCTVKRWHGFMPWVILNRMSLFAVLWRKFDHASECPHDSILCAPQLQSASMNCLVTAEQCKILFSNVGGITSFQMMPTLPRLRFLLDRFWIVLTTLIVWCRGYRAMFQTKQVCVL
jgi:hypothetical protein